VVHRHSFERKADAEAHLDAVGHAQQTGTYIDSIARRVTFGEYADAWIAAQPHRTTTASSVESIFRNHITPTFGSRRLSTIRTSEIQAWVSGLDLAPSTVSVVYGKLSAVFRAAVEDRLLPHSPCTRSIKLPRPDGHRVVPMSPDQVAAMIDTVGDRYRALLVVLAGTGLRAGEALGLTDDRVDFLRRQIVIDRQLVTNVGSLPTFGPCKTESSVRAIPAPDLVLAELARHFERYGTGTDGLLFTDSKGDPIRRNALGHLWRRVADKAGVVGFTPHDLRHYAASVMIEAGCSVKVVQHHLGHAKASTTLDTYAHLWPDSEDTTRRVLDAGLERIVSHACHAEASNA
jgi:integrase